ncbi:MAG: DUF3291 domain-containing protein [Acidobacteriota bacterium]
MPLVSVTRLRIRHWWYVPAFTWQSLRSARQAARSPGNLAVRLRRDPHRTYWTMTAWTDEAAMRAFMVAGAHGAVMKRLLTWSDEAALVHWTQDVQGLPAWEEAHQRLAREGRRSKVLHPSPAHDAFEIAPPRPGRRGELTIK